MRSIQPSWPPLEEVSIVIVTYNSERVIGECLRALRSSLENFSGEVIIIDNHSLDRTISIANSFVFCTTKILEQRKNLGFAKACNEGVRAASGRYVCLLNPDVFVKPGWLPPLVEVLEGDPFVAAVVPHLYREDRTVESVGTVVTYPPLRLRPLFYKGTGVIKEVAILGFACALFPKRVLELLPLDEKMFLYNEDFDFCILARLAGYKLVLCGRSSVVHAGGHAGAGRKLQLRAEAYFNRTVMKCASMSLVVKGLVQEFIGILAGVKNLDSWYTYQKVYALVWPVVHPPVRERTRTLRPNRVANASPPITENSFWPRTSWHD